MRDLLVVLLTSFAATASAEEPPRARYEALVGEFEAARRAAVEAVAGATTDQARMEASLKRPQPAEFAPRFFALADEHPEDAAALDALIWVASECVFGPDAARAMERIARDHGRSDRLKDFCGRCSRYGEPFRPYEEMLRAVLRDNPHRDVQGAACLALADHLKMAQTTTESHLLRVALKAGFRRSPESLANFERMQRRGLDAVGDEAAALFQRVIDQHPDLVLPGNHPARAAELAGGELYVLRNLSIGSKAPEIVGEDVFGKPMTLGENRGKVVVLDFGSHRSCGVCRQYYPHLRSMVEAYKDRPFALLGISVEDDVAELKALSEKGEITWPTWWDGEDLAGPIAARWAIRSMPTFYVLDREGIIRNKGFIQPDELTATVEMLLEEKGLADRAVPAGGPRDGDARP